jgi:hypothetical protein
VWQRRRNPPQIYSSRFILSPLAPQTRRTTTSKHKSYPYP